MIDTAFVLAAGKGTRMAPLTDHIPKPLVTINGRPLLDYVFDHLRASRVQHIVVNSHHHPEKIAAYLDGLSGFDIRRSQEDILLETGGGLQKAAPLIGGQPFFMINGDAFWVDGPSGSVLSRLEAAFDAGRMDILLLLIPVARMVLTEGVGDYDVADNGRAIRSKTKTGTHMFTGIRIVHPRILEGLPEGKYSFLQQMDAAEAAGRLFALEHDGEWHHISTPADVERVSDHLSN